MWRRRNRILSNLLNEWHDVHKIEIEPSTSYGYKIKIPKIVEYFGDIDIRNITSDRIQDYIIYLKKGGLSNSTICKRIAPLKLAFDFAVERKYLKSNPFILVRMPKRGRVELVPFTESEMQQLLVQEFIPWVKDSIVIAYHTGMRLGEIFGLRWTDINFDQSFIMTQRSVTRVGSKPRLKTTKTPSGIRRIDIDKYLLDYLFQIKKESRSRYVFSKPGEDAFMVPWNMAARVREMCVQAGVAPRDFKTLRHTHATVLLAHSVHPKVVQERLGHSDIRITMETYSHVTPTIQRAAVDVFENRSVPVALYIRKKENNIEVLPEAV